MKLYPEVSGLKETNSFLQESGGKKRGEKQPLWKLDLLSLTIKEYLTIFKENRWGEKIRSLLGGEKIWWTREQKPNGGRGERTRKKITEYKSNKLFEFKHKTIFFFFFRFLK